MPHTITLEATIEWAEALRDLLHSTDPLPLAPQSNSAQNKPRMELSSEFRCAPPKHAHDMGIKDWEEYRASTNCVRLNLRLQWGGKTRWLQEPIEGTRITIDLCDRRPPGPMRRVQIHCGHFDARELAAARHDGGLYLVSLPELADAIVEWIEERAPIRFPSQSAMAQSTNSEPTQGNPEEVAEDHVQSMTDDVLMVRWLKTRGFTRCPHFAELLVGNGGRILYQEPALWTGADFDRRRFAPICEVCYEIDGQRMYAYSATHLIVDDWLQEAWVTPQRLSAEAAYDTLLAARTTARMSR